jgi:predicted deacylase
MKIAIEDFDPDAVPYGTKRVVELVLELPATSCSLPALVVSGRTAGRTLVATAGVHGDEFEGILALYDVFERLDPGDLRGRFIAVPICNPWAYQAGSRKSPKALDGTDLARTFPGRKDGSPTQRLAYHLMSLAQRNLGDADLFVDLHSGGTCYIYTPIAGFRDVDNSSRSASEAAARRTGIQRIWAMPATPGSFNYEIALRCIPSVGCETGGQGIASPSGVRAFTTAILNLLAHADLTSTDPPPAEVSPARHTYNMLASSDGLLLRPIDPGTVINSGDCVTAVASRPGEKSLDILSPHSGEIWASRQFATFEKDEILCLIAIGKEA